MGKLRKDQALWQFINRRKFDELVEKWEVDKWMRGLSTWELTCALVSLVTHRLSSYREVEQTLGIPRSTFGDALAKRSSGFFEELCESVLRDVQSRIKNRKLKRAIREVLAIDSTECRVHGSLFNVPGWKTSRCASRQAAVKMHVVWNIDQQWVENYVLTGARRNDSPISFKHKIQANKVYVFDRAYSNVKFWLKIMAAGSHFVTRLRTHCQAPLQDGRTAEAKTHDGVLYDGIYQPQISSLFNAKIPSDEHAEIKFRYIVYRDPLTKKVFHFVTSDFCGDAQLIADIYKQRWAVELLFRWLKGHLNIRYLECKNTNAVRIQLALAILTQLLLQLKKMTEKYQGTLWELLRTIRTDLLRESLSRSDFPDACRWKAAAIKRDRMAAV